ncbi:hypothetical protein ACFLXN_02090 [Chloroflexota bacterium]
MIEQNAKSAVENLKKLKGMMATLSYEDNFKQWQSITQEILEDVFGASSKQARAFKNINYIPLFMSTYMSIEKMEELFARGLSQAEELLTEAIKELEKS